MKFSALDTQKHFSILLAFSFILSTSGNIQMTRAATGQETKRSKQSYTRKYIETTATEKLHLRYLPFSGLKSVTEPFANYVVLEKPAASDDRTKLIKLEKVDYYAYRFIEEAFETALAPRLASVLERMELDGTSYFYSTDFMKKIKSSLNEGKALFGVIASEILQMKKPEDRDLLTKVTVREVLEFTERNLSEMDYKPNQIDAISFRIRSKSAAFSKFQSVLDRPVEKNTRNVMVLYQLLRARFGSNDLFPIRSSGEIDSTSSKHPVSIIDYLEMALTKGYTYGQVINDVL